MARIISKQINLDDLKKLAEAIGGFYIKVVVDLEKEVLVAGAKMHVEEEQMLINEGSSQENLWGGGYDIESKQITYDSIINNKPEKNPSSDILDADVRKKFGAIVKKLLDI
jgi:hypothetical protein